VPVVEVVVVAADAELAADALWQARPSAVEEHVLDDGRVRLRADVAAVELVDGRWAPTVVVVDDGHLDAWRRHAEPLRAGRRVLVQPAWVPPAPAAPGDVVVVLEPQRTFGSGSHPSTRLVVAAIEDHLVPGARVLDLGTGSGVLAIVAARLGATTVLATDIDPAVLEVVPANASANGVAGQVRVTVDDDSWTGGAFDLVLANIGLAVLCDLAEAVVRATVPGGRIVLAGLLDHQAAEAVAAYEPCTEVARSTEDGWSVVVLQR
jgi:ribosomal protein L11 methyltransferase